ncbi:hypothetical protein BV898_04830 [Hypsibius exemplaris]|uniref:Uncharacterized protein n=1 Tax=Hypsibius exemplaris TaxID=2072580 RepID=A0A1W0X0V0_HYPEX|nr:hypothetical protein BV898_04830 [Hypsibius exemplaris]
MSSNVPMRLIRADEPRERRCKWWSHQTVKSVEEFTPPPKFHMEKVPVPAIFGTTPHLRMEERVAERVLTFRYGGKILLKNQRGSIDGGGATAYLPAPSTRHWIHQTVKEEFTSPKARKFQKKVDPAPASAAFGPDPHLRMEERVAEYIDLRRKMNALWGILDEKGALPAA